MKAWTHRCSRGAWGAMFSSEAWKPLEKALTSIERAAELLPEAYSRQGVPR